MDWEWYDDPNVKSVWLHILLSASWEDKEWRGIKIKSGQCIFGRIEWSEKLKISQQTMRTCINKLKSTSQITIKSTNKYSIITVLKWSDYQPSKKNQPANQPANQQIINKPSTTSKEREERKEEKEGKKNFSKNESQTPGTLSLPRFDPESAVPGRVYVMPEDIQRAREATQRARERNKQISQTK